MAESTRQRLERAEDEQLAPYALRASEATRRYRIEDAGRAFDYRSQFQRDRDRIVYSRAFRRLRHKAQAGILPAYEDHRRNRLTHTLEVTQLARTMSRALRLNEDLTEAVALGHDLGQPPFGPTGERALDDLLSGRLDGQGGAGVGDIGGFDHASQGLRVVDLLEKRYDHPGLNLTDPVREGILKCGTRGGVGEKCASLRSGLAPLLETQVVRLADRLAGALHDLDDALQSGTVEIAPVEKLQVTRQLRRKLGPRYPTRAGRFIKANAIHRGSVHLFVTGAILATRRRLEGWVRRHEINDPQAFRLRRDEALGGAEVGLAPSAERMLEEVERFLDATVRRGHAADQVEARGRRILLGLFVAYHADPTLLEDHVLIRFKQVARRRFLRDLDRSEVGGEIARHYHRDPRFVRVLVDHLSAMTDTFSIAEHERLQSMAAIPIPSAEQLRREDTPRV